MRTHAPKPVGRAALPVLLSATVLAVPLVGLVSKLVDVLTSEVGGTAAGLLVVLIASTLVPIAVVFTLAVVLVVDRILPGDSSQSS